MGMHEEFGVKVTRMACPGHARHRFRLARRAFWRSARAVPAALGAAVATVALLAQPAAPNRATTAAGSLPPSHARASSPVLA